VAPLRIDPGTINGPLQPSVAGLGQARDSPWVPLSMLPTGHRQGAPDRCHFRSLRARSGANPRCRSRRQTGWCCWSLSALPSPRFALACGMFCCEPADHVSSRGRSEPLHALCLLRVAVFSTLATARWHRIP
jgi:hypothetical protein